MTDIPIIFSAPMIRAFLANQKTMTRRLAWRDAKFGLQDYDSEQLEDMDAKGWNVVGEGNEGLFRVYKPTPWQRVKIGDRLWPREAMAARIGCNGKPDKNPRYVKYRADTKGESPYDPMDFHRWPNKWSPAIHCPRWASRITILVTGTKMEPLQSISEEDARAEGIITPMIAGQDADGNIKTYRTGFAHLWSELHGVETWLSNPEVVAISGRIIKANIDTAEARAAA